MHTQSAAAAHLAHAHAAGTAHASEGGPRLAAGASVTFAGGNDHIIGDENGENISAAASRCSSPSSTRGPPVSVKYSRETFYKAREHSAVKKLNAGDFDNVTIQDIEELFNDLDENCNGNLDFEELKLLLKEVLDPPCTDNEIDVLYEFTDKRDDGLVGVEELHIALTAGLVKQHLKQLQKEDRIKKDFDKSLGINALVSRELFLKKVEQRVNRDDAFRTLPMTLVYISFFIAIVVTHLTISQRHKVEKGLEEWLHGFGADHTGPFFDAYVADFGGMFDWMKRSGLPAVFSDCQPPDSSVPSQFFCNVGPRNILIGDVRMERVGPEDVDEKEWLLHSAGAKDHLRSEPTDFLGAAWRRAEELKAERWGDTRFTDELGFTLLTYCTRAKILAVTRVSARLDDYGRAVTRIGSHALSAEPYYSEVLYALDAMFVLLILLPLYMELRELVSGIRMGGCGDGCRGYWGIWNIVDWVSIAMGITVCTIWYLGCRAIGVPSIKDLLRKDGNDLVLVPIVMQLTVEELDQTMDDISHVGLLFFALHIAMGAQAVAIMMKFFKAFQANPRLQLVTNTLVRAAVDIFHFSIVFTAIFVGFAVTAHVWFGSDMVAFSSFGASVNTAFIVLFGEFGWYIDVSESEQGLTSGMPRILVGLWFWFYMVCVLLILLNMLLAIILEHYSELVMELKTSTDIHTIWKQTWGYLKHSRATQGFLPMYDIQCSLQDDDTPGHPEHKVTQESLLRAFPKMSDQQAKYIMTWMQKEATNQMKDQDVDESTARLMEIKAFMESMAEEMHLIALNVTMVSKTVQDLVEPDSPLTPDGTSSTGLARRTSGKKKGTWGSMRRTSSHLGTEAAGDASSSMPIAAQVGALSKLVSTQLDAQRSEIKALSGKVAEVADAVGGRIGSKSVLPIPPNQLGSSFETRRGPARELPASCWSTTPTPLDSGR